MPPSPATSLRITCSIIFILLAGFFLKGSTVDPLRQRAASSPNRQRTTSLSSASREGGSSALLWNMNNNQEVLLSTLLEPIDFDDVDPADENQPQAHHQSSKFRNVVDGSKTEMMMTTATNRLCPQNATNITFFRPNAPRCRVWIYVAIDEVPPLSYDAEVCRMLHHYPKGNIYSSMGPMAHAYNDYVLAEVFKAHPCRIYSLDDIPESDHHVNDGTNANTSSTNSSSTEHTNHHHHLNNVVGYIPLTTNSKSANPQHIVDGIERVTSRSASTNATSKQGQLLRQLTRQGRWFTFIPSILYPHPLKRWILKHMLHINFVIHEVATWARNTKVAKKRDNNLLVHSPRKINTSGLCFRHTVLPKVDWDIKAPLPITTTSTSDKKLETPPKSTLIFCSGRVQSVDRATLWLVAKHASPRNFTFVSGPNIQSSFSGGMTGSVFCIDTTGDSLTTTRITNAVLRGCIPVLICDDCVFPFAKLFNYRIANNYEEMVESLKAAPFRSRYPTFAIRISQYTVLWKKPQRVVDMLYRLYHEERALVNKLYAGLQRVQKYFLSPFEKGSRYADALLEDMNIGATRLNNLDLNKLCPY